MKALLKNNSILKIVFALFLLSALLLFFNFFYNQDKGILASEEDLSHRELDCGEEIPVGEAMEKTTQLAEDLIQEFDSIYANVYYQIKAAEEMIELANKCDITVCEPIDCGSYTVTKCDTACDDEGDCTTSCWTEIYCYAPSNCTSVWNGWACPQNDIKNEFEKVLSAYNSIKNSKENIFGLIDGKSIKNIEDDLYLSRGEFNKCYISPADWAKIEKGELLGKVLLNCPLVMKGDFSRQTKTTEKVNDKEVPVCTSIHNWFCCSEILY